MSSRDLRWATAVTAYVAVPLLALIGIFGLLVVTGTPLHAVPDRVRGLRHGGETSTPRSPPTCPRPQRSAAVDLW